MPSPFPGMDPYLEDPAYWRDFHVRFVNYLYEAIAGKLPDEYEARIDERVTLVEIPPPQQWESGSAKRVLPDIAITRHDTSAGGSGEHSTTAIFEPVTIPLIFEIDDVRETYIEIFHRGDRSLVTVLELLSPTNKNDMGFYDYLSKRAALLRQSVHLVELDLLIGGNRLPTAISLPKAHYYAFIARGDRRPNADVYAWTVRDALPTIPVPLKSPDSDVSLDLAPVFEIAFDRGRYARPFAWVWRSACSPFGG